MGGLDRPLLAVGAGVGVAYQSFGPSSFLLLALPDSGLDPFVALHLLGHPPQEAEHEPGSEPGGAVEELHVDRQ
jgi:hypothetical protein